MGVIRSLLALVLASGASLAAAPAASAWHAEGFEPPSSQRYIHSLSVTVGQQAWVLAVRTQHPEEIAYSSWYLDVGDRGPGRHRGAEYLLVSAPGELQLFTLPTADPSEIGGLACDQVTVAPLRRERAGEKVRIAQSCLGSPERLRVRLSVSAGEQSFSWSPGARRTEFHPWVRNVDHPADRGEATPTG